MMLRVIVPVKLVESTVPLMFPASPAVPVWAAHVPVTVALVWLRVTKTARGT